MTRRFVFILFGIFPAIGCKKAAAPPWLERSRYHKWQRSLASKFAKHEWPDNYIDIRNDGVDLIANSLTEYSGNNLQVFVVKSAHFEVGDAMQPIFMLKRKFLHYDVIGLDRSGQLVHALDLDNSKFEPVC